MAMLVKNVSEMQDLDQPCIVMQIWSKLDEKCLIYQGLIQTILLAPLFWIFHKGFWCHTTLIK